MEPDIVLSTNGMIALGVFGAICFVILMVTLIIATLQNEKLEKKLAEATEQLEAAKQEKEKNDLLCEGAFRLMTWLKERDQ